MSEFASEQDLAAVVVAWLHDQRWEVYQEVEGPPGRADIVAVMGGRVWVIEAKTRFGLAVIKQAVGWKPWAHWVSIAVPKAPSPHTYEGKLLAGESLGALSVHPFEVTQTILPRLVRWVDRSTEYGERGRPGALLRRLKPEHQTVCAAGSSRGGHWTAFKSTARSIRQIVQAHAGISLKDLVDRCEHHYGTAKTARSCIASWVKAGYVPGVRCEQEGKFLRFYTER